MGERRKMALSGMENVLARMRDGWELGLSTGLASRAWLQKGGCGYGGESINVNGKTFDALVRHKLIFRKTYVFPLAVYDLTEKL